MSIVKKVFDSEIKGIDEQEMTLTAYVSTSGRDRHNESVDASGGNFANYKKNPVVLWAHDYSKPPIGKALWIKRDGEGVVSKVKFANTPFAQEIFQLYKEGYMKAFSIGFMPDFNNIEDGDGDKKPRRTYKKWEMLEYSAVPVPANPEALALAVKRGILKTESLKEAMEVKEEDLCEAEAPAIASVSTGLSDATNIEITWESKTSGFDELNAEITLLRQQLSTLETENLDLRFKLYEALTKAQKQLSGIVVEHLAEKAVEMANRAIRKAKGKVD